MNPELLRQLEEIAQSRFDGHLSILRLTTNWRVAFYTPNSRGDIMAMLVGKTFDAAATAALAAPKGWAGPYCDLCGDQAAGHDCKVNAAFKKSLAEFVAASKPRKREN